MHPYGRFSWLLTLLGVLLLSTAPARGQEQQVSALAPMPLGRAMFVAVAVAGQIYCVGGNGPGGNPLAAVHAYDVARNTWSAKAPWPTPTSYPCGAAVRGKVYVIGSPTGQEDRTSVVECYDPATNTWTRLANLPVPRSHSVAVALGEMIYVLGGFGYNTDPEGQRVGKDLDDVWILDTRTNRWQPGPRLPRPMHGMAAAVIQGKIHLFGSLTAPQHHWQLDGTTWRPRAEIPFPVVKIPATGLKDKAVVLGGGDDESQVAVYEAATDRWQLASPTRMPRFLAQAVTVQEKVYALGSVVHRPKEGVQSKVECYEPEKNRWRE
jgi:N-acetylneuraminic acid mutarotase